MAINTQTKWIIGTLSFVGLAVLTRKWWMPQSTTPTGVKNDSTIKTSTNVGVAPSFDEVYSLVQVALKKGGITPTSTQQTALQSAFGKWSIQQRKFAYDYVNGFNKVNALTPNSKAWNDAFTEMNNYLMKTYPDEKMKLEVMQYLS